MANAEVARDRSWDVLLVGGAPGTGKTEVASRLAHHFAVGTSAVDDFQIIIERMTTPEQQPVVHFWRTHPDPDQLSAIDIMRQGLEVSRVMAPALEAVIADHLDASLPIVLEGDFLSPALAAQTSFGGRRNDGRVRGVFLHESDEAQILINLGQREPEAGRQVKRARVSWLHGEWLKEECARWGVPALPARPWATIFDRVVEAAQRPARP